MHEGREDVLLLLTATVIAVGLARALRLPPLLAYLVAGMAVGPYGLRWLPHTKEGAAFADFGIVFLMFSIGLEFSLARLFAMRRVVFGLGTAQMAATILVTVALALAVGQSWRYGFVVGCAVAMSSTAIVMRLLADREELHSAPGRQTVGVLLLQDLAVVPLMILIPALGSEPSSLAPALGIALLKGAIILAALMLLGQKLMQTWFDMVARQESHELFVVNILWLVVGLAFLTAAAGLSLALGAFIGGVLISETVYRHQVAADIRPFRDVLLGLFFVTIGMQLNLNYVVANISWVAAMVALLVVGKGLIVLALALALRNPLSIALNTALHLAQAGEFGFVLVAEAASADLLDLATKQVVLASMLLSMLLAPLLVEHGSRLIGSLRRRETGESLNFLEDQVRHVEDHVIICSYGRMGQSLARFLERESIPFVALDTDPQRVREATAAGERVVYGNADQQEVLLAAGLRRAKAVVIAYADPAMGLKVLRMVRRNDPKIPVIVRAADDSQLDVLKSEGATEVVPEILEGSLMLAMQTLSRLGVSPVRAMEQVREVRSNRYELLRHFYRAEEDRLRDALAGNVEPRRSLEIPESAYAVGKRFVELALGEQDVKLVGFVHNGVRCEAASEDAIVAPGDVLILAGSTTQLEAAESYLLRGKDLTRPGRQSAPAA
jgi:CPA2 family monovalent cation:H+ antiporter-2